MLPTPRLLTELLQQQGHLLYGAVESVREVERFEGYADAIVRLGLTFTDNEPRLPATLIAKVFGSSWYSHYGQPEVRFYCNLAPLMPQMPVPALLGAHDDAQRSTALLLLEDLAEQYVPATLPIAEDWLDLLVDVLIELHAAWWQPSRLDAPDFLVPEQGVTRMPQALNEAGLRAHAASAQDALGTFLAGHAHELSVEEQTLLRALSSYWPDLFRTRVVNSHAITLLHGDLHLLGNVFLAKKGIAGGVKLIDWTQAKRGLGPHDLMYLLLSVDVPDRVGRDTRLLRRYHEGLLAKGVSGYAWAQCVWDYRFSMLTNLWQSIFQNSLRWLRKTKEVVRVWECEALLTPTGE